MGKAGKKKAHKKLAGREKGKRKGFPVLFSCLRFLNSADPTTSETGTGYEVYGRVEKSVILVGKRFPDAFLWLSKSRENVLVLYFFHIFKAVHLHQEWFYTKGLPFLSKMVYIKVYGVGPRGRASPRKI